MTFGIKEPSFFRSYAVVKLNCPLGAVFLLRTQSNSILVPGDEE